MTFELARRVADAVLYEGYVLYPYRASSQKNQARWQFGVLGPPLAAGEAGADAPASQTECLLEGDQPELTLLLRFLQVQRRTVEAAAGDGFEAVASLEHDGGTLVPWDEGVQHEVALETPVSPGEVVEHRFELPAAREVGPLRSADGAVTGQVVRERWPLSGLLRVEVERLDGPYGLLRLRLRTENTSAWRPPAGAGRDQALRRSLIAAHSLLALRGGRFVSLLEPPEWARPAAESCRNVGTWPVLVAEEQGPDVVLSSPIILYDHPTVAPESAGDLYDATEIDEILTLRTMALTEDEKREARGTDERAAAIIDRVDATSAEVLARLHGALRLPVEPAPQAERLPWWDPGADESVSPETDTVQVGAAVLRRGSVVRLHPGRRRADAQDMFLEGRAATVEAVLSDVEGNAYLAVTLVDDEAADIERWQGRFRYFSPDEVEPLDTGHAGVPSQQLGAQP